MPSKKAKERKRKRHALNKKWAVEGRTANQHKKWVAKTGGHTVSRFGVRR